MGIDFTGIAAATELDALTASDFEPEIEVDTVALDATLDAIIGTKRLLTRLERLARHLAAAGDPATAEGLAVEVRLTIERLDAITAGTLA